MTQAAASIPANIANLNLGLAGKWKGYDFGVNYRLPEFSFGRFREHGHDLHELQ